MHVMCTIAILGFVLAAGCAGVREAPPSAMAPSGRLVVDSSLLAGNQDGVTAAQADRSEAIQETIALKPPSAAPRLNASGRVVAQKQ